MAERRRGQRTPTGRGRQQGRARARYDIPRRAAFDVVHAVDERQAYANLTLPAVLAEADLDARDAAFVTELAYGTLRRCGTYDEILGHCADRPLAKLDSEVRDVLRLGTHQILGMRVPTHAAVSTSVDLTRTVAGHGPAKFVNAILRKVAAQDLAGWLERCAPSLETDPVGHLALVHFHPRWMVEAFRDALGENLEETALALAADDVAPKVTLAAWPGRSTVEELGGTQGRWSPYAVTLDAGDPARIAAIRQRRAGVQDEGSQLMAYALAAAPVEGSDRRWLDVCAGPGGKAALLAAVGSERGAWLLANEIQAHRAKLVAGLLPGRVIRADGTRPAWPEAVFDRVLADVPCTGLGALRRRPEARWRRTPEAVGELRPLQLALLRSALDSTRPGGVAAYVTCSPHLRETRDVVEEVLAGRDDVVRLDAREHLPAMPDLGPGPDVQLWPHRHGTDAMFLALLRRVA